MMIVGIIVCVTVLVLFLCLVVISHFLYHRSVMSTVVEWYLRLTEKHYTKEELNEAFKNRIVNGDGSYSISKRMAKRLDYTEKEYCGMQVFHINEQVEAEKVVVYLHGGAYYRKPRNYHFRFIENVSREAKLPFIVPIYKKAPNHSCREAYDLLTKLYNEIKSKYKQVILMGDSSGGGLALGLAQHLKNQEVVMPSCLILLSPWVDIALENRQIEKFIKKDPLVFLDNVQLLGKAWAKDLPLDDYRVSPINGNMKGLPNTYIFCGTREILYPDCALLYEKIKSSGTPVDFYKGEGQNHVYPIFPLIKEAKEARKAILKILASN